MFFLVIFSLISIYIIHVLLFKLRRCTAPGPAGIPVFGYLLFLGKHPPTTLLRLQKKFGTIFRLQLGREQVLVLGDYASTKEALNQESLLFRPPNGVFPAIDQFKHNITESNGRLWLQHRRFFLHSFRNLGLGKSVMEDLIGDEIAAFIGELSKTNGQAISPEKFLRPSLNNNMLTVSIGRRLSYGSKDLKVVYVATEIQDIFLGQGGLFLYLPWLNPVLRFFGWCGLRELNVALDDIKEFIKKEIKQHKETLDENNPRDYIDHYLIESNEKLCRGEENFFDENHLIGNIFTILSAGSNTLMNTMNWIILILASFSDVQKKMYEEILEVIGTERRPAYTDIAKMPYTKAVLKEAQRWRTVLPLNIVRFAVNDTRIQGYQVPRGTWVISNLWSVNNDPKCWKNPEEFNPQRFLDLSGKKVEGFIPFSMGRRSCPGEAVAQIEYFLYTVTLVQKFLFKIPEGENPTLEPELLGIGAHVYPYKICFVEREKC